MPSKLDCLIYDIWAEVKQVLIGRFRPNSEIRAGRAARGAVMTGQAWHEVPSHAVFGWARKSCLLSDRLVSDFLENKL